MNRYKVVFCYQPPLGLALAHEVFLYSEAPSTALIDAIGAFARDHAEAFKTVTEVRVEVCHDPAEEVGR